MAKRVEEQWIMKFDGSSTANSRGAGVVLYRIDEETVGLSFKLEFPCLNNTAKYEAYQMGLAMTLEMGIKHLRVIGDSNLVVCQANGSFSLKEPSLALYRMLAQRMENFFCTFEIKFAQSSESQYVDALVALGSEIDFEGGSFRVEIKKQREFKIEILKEKFLSTSGYRRTVKPPSGLRSTTRSGDAPARGARWRPLTK